MCHSWSAQCTLQETVRYGGPGEPHTFEACNPEGDAEFSVAATPMRCRVLVHPRLVASGNPFTVLEPSGYPTMITRSWDARKGKVRPLVDWLLEPFRATSLLTAFGIMVVLVLGLYRFGSLAAAFQYIAGERSIVDGQTKSFGSLATGERSLVRFRLTNVSTRPIKLLGLQSTCACTVATNIPASIGPSSSFDLDVQVSPPLRPGALKETLTVFSDSPGRPSLPLFVVGRVTNHDPEATNEGVH